MGVYLKNKPSTVNYIVSNGILQFLLMAILSIWLILPTLLENIGPQNTGLIELSEEVDDEDIDRILILLHGEEWIDKFSINHISKEDAISIMEEEIDASMKTRVVADMPLRDVIVFFTDSEISIPENFEDLKAKSKSESAISGIYHLDDAGLKKSSKVGSWSRLFSLPMSLLIALLTFLFLSSSVRSIIGTNKKMIKSLIDYGAEPSYTISMLRRNLSKETLVGWLLGLILFLMAFYLILMSIKMGFSDISLEMMALTIFLPLLLSLIFIQFAVKRRLLSI